MSSYSKFCFHRQIEGINGMYSVAGLPKYKFTKTTMDSRVAQLLFAVKYNPGCTRAAAMNKIYYMKKLGPSYGSCIWRMLLANSYLKKERVGKTFKYFITDKGNEIIEKVLSNTFSF